jgi:hypothetical protein
MTVTTRAVCGLWRPQWLPKLPKSGVSADLIVVASPDDVERHKAYAREHVSVSPPRLHCRRVHSTDTMCRGLSLVVVMAEACGVVARLSSCCA